MTTLSILTLNPKSRQCRNDMRNAQALHRRVMGLFPHTPSVQARHEFGVLWRIEPTETPTLLLQSLLTPDFGALPGGYASHEHKNIDSHLGALTDGQIVRYRVTLNPVKSSRLGGRNSQTTIPFAEQPRWWKTRSETIGLVLLDSPALIGQPAMDLRRNGTGSRLPIYSTRVDGVAEIIDANNLRNAITSGVGRGKAWGCGLLTVAKSR